MSFSDLKIRHAETLAKELQVEAITIIAHPMSGDPKYFNMVSIGASFLPLFKIELIRADCNGPGLILTQLPRTKGGPLDDDIERGNPQSPETRRRQDGDAK